MNCVSGNTKQVEGTDTSKNDLGIPLIPTYIASQAYYYMPVRSRVSRHAAHAQLAARAGYADIFRGDAKMKVGRLPTSSGPDTKASKGGSTNQIGL